MPAHARLLADERDQLLSYLAHQRAAARIAAFGLTDDQARTVPTSSSLSVGGILKHLASTERGWVSIVLGRSSGSDEDYLANFTMSPADTLDGLLADYDVVASETESVVGRLDLDHRVPVPRGVPWFPQDVEAWTLRWVLLHLIEETAHHAGHADILRESIDGATAVSLLAAAEGWPPTDWVTPWRPDGA
jgi:uncharacterized damage-inducible protein DinB